MTPINQLLFIFLVVLVMTIKSEASTKLTNGLSTETIRNGATTLSVNFDIYHDLEYEIRNQQNLDLVLGFNLLLGVAPSSGLQGGSFFLTWKQ